MFKVDTSVNSTLKHLFSDVIFSMIGASCWLTLLIAWEIFFQIERAKGLEWTDRLSFVFPVGYV